jgi:hypothetical protein
MRTEKIAAPGARAEGARGAGRPGAWLWAELAGLAAPALWIALVALLLVFLAVPQLPLRYGFDVGYEEGVGSDLPYLQGFNTAERDELGTYRWTDDGATIVVPGVGARELLVRLDWLPTPAAVRDVSPAGYELYAGDSALGALPLRPEGGSQIVVVPASALADGSLELTLRTATFTLPGDPRALGARLSGVEIVGLANPLPRSPHWQAILTWLGAVVLGWMAVRRALGAAPARIPHPSAVILALFALFVAAAAVLDPPRWAFGAEAALVACALAYGLAIVTRAALPPIAARLGVPLDATSLGWLSLIVVVSFALRFGGRLYPDSMHGDIGFHHNRFNEAVWGLIYIISVNRGVEFPYPPGPYAVIAPLTLLGLDPRTVLQLGAALADAVSAAVVYAITTRVAGQRTALLAAGLYVFTAATFMTTWWSFDTHIYTQFFHLLLVAALCWGLEAWETGRQEDILTAPPAASLPAGRRARQASWVVALLLAMVFLGHFGFLINTTIMLGLVATTAWAASWRGAEWGRRVRWPLIWALAGAGLAAAVFFYTAYVPLFLAQLATAREGGLTAVAGRGPVSRAVMWERLWRDGLVVHFGLFPLLLMPWGIAIIWREARGEPWLGRRRAVAGLMLASLAVAVMFAVFPFAAGVTNSPRWMLFIAWVVAVGSAVAVTSLWRRGWWGRAAAVIMAALVLANTAWVWLGPMLWRIRPPEPF